jgi:TonB-dependent receptor
MKISMRKHWLSTGVSALALATFATAVVAQDATAPTGDKAAADAKAKTAEDNQVVIVTARRKALKTAIDIKKDSDTIVDSIVADEAGQLPDTSITEVLQRVSGVTLSRFSSTNGGTPSFQIEGTGISVRGLPYNSSTLNGRQVFSANGASGIQWQEVTPELGAGVDVYKAARADILEGGTSSIDLKSRLPFDYKKPTFDLSAGASYGDQIKKTSPNVSALFTKRFDTKYGEMGFLVDLAYSQYYSQDSDANLGPYLLENDPNVASGKALVPSGYGWSQTSHQRDRYGAYEAFQWRPTDNFTFTSTLFYSQYHNDDISHSGGWSNNPSTTYENIPQNATFDSAGAMTKGAIYVGATGGATPVFGWGGNNWLYQYLPKGDPSYEWIWGETWSPDYGHNASNTLLTADCRTQYGALTSSSPNIDWGKWASPGMFYCQQAAAANTNIGLNLGANTSYGKGDSGTLDFSNSFVWTPSDRMRVRGAVQYTRSIAKGLSMYTGITQSDPNLSHASFDVTHDVPVLGGFDATALKNTNTAYFNSMSYNGSDNNGSMVAANIDVDYHLDGDHFFRDVSFGARIAGRKERDDFIGTYWAPVAEGWVGNTYPDGSTAGYAPYLTGGKEVTGPYTIPDTFNGVTKQITVTPYDTVRTSDYQLETFANFFAGKSPSPGTVLVPSDALMKRFDWQHLAALSADATADAINVAHCKAFPNDTDKCSPSSPNYVHPGSWTPQQYYNSHIDQGLGITNSRATNKALYVEAKFGGSGFGFIPAFTGNMGLRYVINDLHSQGNFQVNPGNAFYLTPACANAAAGAAAAASPGVGGTASGPITGIMNCDQYTAVKSQESRTADYSYARLLPSFNVKFNVSSKIIFRLAASQAMSMPNLNDIKAGGSVSPNLVNVPAPGNSSINYLYTMTSNTGANRKPVMFTDGDASLEWYPKDGAYAYIDLFRKELRDQDLYTSFYQNHATTLLDVTTQKQVTVDLPWFYQSNLSAHKAAEIAGFELGGRTFLDWLPSPFNGFGVNGSVTYVSSRNPAILANSVQGPYIPDNSGKTNNNGPVPGNSNTDFKTLPYFGMAKWSYNVELYYSKGPFTTRLAYNWHAKQLLSTNSNPLSYNATGGNPYTCTACLDNVTQGQIWEMVPLWSAAAGYVDWSADYKLNDRVSFGVSAGNLTKTVSKTLQEPLPGKFERLDTYMADQRINAWLRFHY